MNNLNIEKHLIKSREFLPRHLAQSLISHASTGKIAVVTNDPQTFMQSTKQEWDELEEATDMPISFTAAAPQDLLDTGVTFATLEDFLRIPPLCQTLYITHSVERQNLYMLTSWMPPKSSVIIFEY